MGLGFSVRDTGQEVSQTCALTVTRWGLARKINYLGDWLMSLSWCLPLTLPLTLTLTPALTLALPLTPTLTPTPTSA